MTRATRRATTRCNQGDSPRILPTQCRGHDCKSLCDSGLRRCGWRTKRDCHAQSGTERKIVPKLTVAAPLRVVAVVRDQSTDSANPARESQVHRLAGSGRANDATIASRNPPPEFHSHHCSTGARMVHHVSTRHTTSNHRHSSKFRSWCVWNAGRTTNFSLPFVYRTIHTISNSSVCFRVYIKRSQ